MREMLASLVLHLMQQKTSSGWRAPDYGGQQCHPKKAPCISEDVPPPPEMSSSQGTAETRFEALGGWEPWSQRLQYPLIKEYTLNYTWIPNKI